MHIQKLKCWDDAEYFQCFSIYNTEGTKNSFFEQEQIRPVKLHLVNFRPFIGLKKVVFISEEDHSQTCVRSPLVAGLN